MYPPLNDHSADPLQPFEVKYPTDVPSPNLPFQSHSSMQVEAGMLAMKGVLCLSQRSRLATRHERIWDRICNVDTFYGMELRVEAERKEKMGQLASRGIAKTGGSVNVFPIVENSLFHIVRVCPVRKRVSHTRRFSRILSLSQLTQSARSEYDISCRCRCFRCGVEARAGRG